MPTAARFHARAHSDLQMSLPLYVSRVPAGYPSAAEDFSDSRIDFNELLIRREEHCFVVTVVGESMQGAGILSGDLLVVDRSLIAKPGDIVVAAINDEALVKELIVLDGLHYLQSHHPDYPPIAIAGDNDVSIWGVVCHAIHSLR
ncbi:LexA family protein [Atopomonas sediminilitoris]|uniref:LexA family protein n=1 Tax=Atopomonas sediminilitoris TaxID=2919919 RepID=UPI001F4DCBA4|nr:translesion error-prone DNA polymerase V autoproteolytic subunit [Atopomonas sediminilitoris]MCJ8168764.1 translesion error-prone DNA polymerase V autoproteolytic subunit [Atopomonas sediminilitoris]